MIDIVSHHCHISEVIKITSSDLSLCVLRTLTFASRCMPFRRAIQKTRTSLNHYFNICRMRRQKFDLWTWQEEKFIRYVVLISIFELWRSLEAFKVLSSICYLPDGRECLPNHLYQFYQSWDSMLQNIFEKVMIFRGSFVNDVENSEKKTKTPFFTHCQFFWIFKIWCLELILKDIKSLKIYIKKMMWGNCQSRIIIFWFWCNSRIMFM